MVLKKSDYSKLIEKCTSIDQLKLVGRDINKALQWKDISPADHRALAAIAEAKHKSLTT